MVPQQALMLVEQFKPKGQLPLMNVRETAYLGRLEKHSGVTLVPPLGGLERREALGELVPDDVDVTGTSWKFSTVDVAVAGAAICSCCWT